VIIFKNIKMGCKSSDLRIVYIIQYSESIACNSRCPHLFACYDFVMNTLITRLAFLEEVMLNSFRNLMTRLRPPPTRLHLH